MELIWVFDKDPETKVVCEGYAKTFQYLCDVAGLECYTVTGETNGSGDIVGAGRHMWNIVTLGGKNYLVDVTNSDAGSIGEDGTLVFLAGTARNDNGSYTFHIGGGGITYAYDADVVDLYGDIVELAEKNYVPATETMLTVSIEGWTYGEKANAPQVESATNGTDHVICFYKEKGAADTAYTTEVPTKAGAYTVKAVFAATANYQEAAATMDFVIAKAPALEAPKTPVITDAKGTLPDGWAWKDESVVLIPGAKYDGTKHDKLTIVSTDTDNYEQITEAEVVVCVLPVLGEGTTKIYQIGSGESAVLKTNGFRDEITGVPVDGKEVGADAYTMSGQETEITFTNAFMDKLAEGEHTITVVYHAGNVEHKLKIEAKAAPETPDNQNENQGGDQTPGSGATGGASQTGGAAPTGDTHQPVIYMIFMGLAAAVLIFRRRTKIS